MMHHTRDIEDMAHDGELSVFLLFFRLLKGECLRTKLQDTCMCDEAEVEHRLCNMKETKTKPDKLSLDDNFENARSSRQLMMAWGMKNSILKIPQIYDISLLEYLPFTAVYEICR